MPRHLRAVQILWRSLLGGTLVMIPGVLGYIVDNIWLFPSLGPSFFMLVVSPHQKSSRTYNAVVGHLLAVACGYFAVLVTGATGIASAFGGGHLLVPHMLASGLAVGLMMLLQLSLDANHAPGASTALLIALGAFRVSWHDFLALVAGILIMAVLGEAVRLYIIWEEPEVERS